MKRTHLLPAGTKITVKDKFLYASQMGGIIPAYFLFTSVMMFFYTDVVGIPAATVGTMMLIAAVWDGINDPLMGIWIDHTRTRWGRCRPFIFWGALAVTVLIVLALNVPDISATGKIVYMYITYIGLGMAFTSSNMGVNIQITRLTRNQDDVASLNSWAYFANNLASIICAALLTTLVTIFSGSEGNMRLGYGRLGLVFGLVTLIAVISSIFLKERDYFDDNESNESHEKKYTFKDYFKAVFTNKPFIILIIASGITSICYMFFMSVIMYYCTYNLNNYNMYSVISAISYIGAFIPIILLPFLTKRFDKKKLYIFSLLLVVVGMALRYVTNDSTTASIVILIFIAFTGYGLWTVLIVPMLIDCASYQRIKTGIDTSGIVICSVTLVSKIGTGIAQSVLGKLMEVFGYVEGAKAQNAAVLSLFKHCTITVMMVGAIISIIVIMFYNLKDKELAKIEAELEQNN